MLKACPARHAARSVASYEKRQKEGDQKPNEGRGAGLRAAAEPKDREDRAHYSTDEAAQD